ncbi:MAG TPA: MlaD family protein, partial [Acetobacteraceae bacterium]|nr:MlaD family protein [Acetobacteraceae bacterium]
MSDTPPQVPRAVVRSRGMRLSWIWALPVVTALIGGWLAWDTLSKRGPLITISFQSAEGLQAGQSHVRHKDVDMGLVQKVALSPDLQHVIVTVRMNREATPLLTNTARFWVVKPRFFAGAVSGLETLLSGAYIELLPGAPGGKPQTDFIGLEDPPVLQSNVPGHTYLLHAARIGSISLGSPIFYRDFDVGEVLGWDIGDMADSVTIHAFVRAPFDQYVHDGSRFWNASGANISLGPKGVQLQLESLRALILGGIAFETLPEARSSPVSAENHEFTLYASQEDADRASFTRHLQFLSLFDGSAAGLAPGAAVTLHGLQIGEVQKVELRYDAAADRVVVAVDFVVEPERISRLQEAINAPIPVMLDAMVRRGLRASLASSNLLTGQKEIALDMVPNAPPAELKREGDTFVLPTTSSAGFGDLAQTAGAILAKVQAIPFDQIGQNLNETLRGTSQIANDAQLRRAIATLQSTLASV